MLLPARGSPPRVAAWGSADMWGAALEIEVTVEGQPDATTGYIVGIDAIDRHTLEIALTELAGGFAQAAHPGACLVAMRERLARSLALRVPSIALRPHPFAEIRVEESMPGFATLSHRFDFAASHRLHCPQLDEDANRRTFGKCNNPAGHGHNYRLETQVRVPLTATPALREIGRAHV